jgi:hypothetical protein
MFFRKGDDFAKHLEAEKIPEKVKRCLSRFAEDVEVRHCDLALSESDELIARLEVAITTVVYERNPYKWIEGFAEICDQYEHFDPEPIDKLTPLLMSEIEGLAILLRALVK